MDKKTLEKDNAVLLDQVAELQRKVTELEDCVYSVGVCNNHVTEITNWSDLRNGCYVCECNALMAENTDIVVIVSQQLNVLKESLLESRSREDVLSAVEYISALEKILVDPC